MLVWTATLAYLLLPAANAVHAVAHTAEHHDEHVAVDDVADEPASSHGSDSSHGSASHETPSHDHSDESCQTCLLLTNAGSLATIGIVAPAVLPDPPTFAAELVIVECVACDRATPAQPRGPPAILL